MARLTGRNQNTNDQAVQTRITINSATAVKLVDPNPDRIYFSVCLAPALNDVDAYIRLYPTADNNDKVGEVLTRTISGNNSLFRSSWQMPVDTIYTGEISAISDAGSFDVIVTEY